MKKIFFTLFLFGCLSFNCSKSDESLSIDNNGKGNSNYQKNKEEGEIPSKYYLLSPDKKTLMQWFNTEATSINMQEDKVLREVTKISDNIFQNCKKVVSIVLPDKLTDIGVNAFGQCEALKSIVIPEGVTIINDMAFSNCKALTQIKLPQNLKSIGQQSFFNCTSLESIDIPNNVENIKDGAFYSSGLTSITIPEKVSFMSNQFNFFITFYQCEKLKSITFLNKMSSIPNSFFYGCKSLERIKFPKNIKTIEAGAFNDCPSLKNITIPSTVTDFSFRDNQYIQSVVIEEGITSIEATAFDNCKALTSITLPKGLKTIKTAFRDCISLKHITIPSTVTHFSFSNNQYIQSVVIEEGIRSIGEEAFADCKSLRSVTLPKGLKIIYKSAFKGCELLEEIKIPNSITYISTLAFAHCYSLGNINIPNNAVVQIEELAFINSGLTSIIIPKGVTFVPIFTNIEPIVFYQCRKLKSITLLNNMTSIGGYFISECDVLENVKLPETLITIDNFLFRDCKAIKHITIPRNVRKINGSAFFASNITTITLEGTIPPELGDTFSVNNKIKKIYVPANSILTYKTANQWNKYANIIEAMP